MEIKRRDVLVCGFALFAIFFGAGNLIFPPFLGISSGDRWYISMFAFLLSDPVLPILGVIVTAKLGGRADDRPRELANGLGLGDGNGDHDRLCADLGADDGSGRLGHDLCVQSKGRAARAGTGERGLADCCCGFRADPDCHRSCS